MKIQPEIRFLQPRLLVGMQLTMSLAENRTAELWSTFMPRIADIQHRKGHDLISLQVYDPDYFEKFNPGRVFTKWAAVEVSETGVLADQLDEFRLPEGLYAVFHYQGLPGNPAIFQYIYSAWLPASEYRLDNRPHFEILGDKYRQNHPESEEEIWIPLAGKQT